MIFNNSHFSSCLNKLKPIRTSQFAKSDPKNRKQREKQMKDYLGIRKLIQLALLSGLIFGCNKVVTYTLDKKAKPTAEPAPPKPVADVVQATTEPPVTPDTKIKLELKRVNADSWWKICLEAWVSEFPQSRQKIGCNTEKQNEAKPIELDASTKQCNNLSLSLSVYRNTETCKENALTCQHEASPSHIRSTTNPADRVYFRAEYLTDLKLPFSRKDLQDIVLPDSFKKEYEELSKAPPSDKKSKPFRVLFEDQITKNYDTWKAGGNAKENGIDFFDYVIELGANDAPLGLEGSEFIKCP
jgi:hypothetical protein